MAKVLVTGGAGFIGSHLVKALEKGGHQVTALDNLRNKSFKNLADFRGDFVLADVSDFDFKDGFDCVFHLASITETYNDNQKEQIQQNIEGFRNLLKVKTSQIIYASSASVYGLRNEEVPFHENMERQPANVYAFTKQQLENMANLYADGRTMTGFRFFNVYGPNESEKGKSASMVYQIFNAIKNDHDFKLFKGGEQKRDFVFVDDVVALLIAAMSKKENGVFNCGSGNAVSFLDIVDAANKSLNKKVKPIFIDCEYDFFQKYTQADLTKVKSFFDWKPKFNLEQGIQRLAI